MKAVAYPSKPRVLLVYDQVDAPMKYLDGLRKWDLEVIFAMDVATALIIAVTQLPNAIVVDMSTRLSNRQTLLARLKRDTRARIIPVIIVSDPRHDVSRGRLPDEVTIYPRQEAAADLGAYLSRSIGPDARRVPA